MCREAPSVKDGNPPKQTIHDKVENRASSGVEARLMASEMAGLLPTTLKCSTLCYIVSSMASRCQSASLLWLPGRRRLIIV
jgi:hypothetical protein